MDIAMHAGMATNDLQVNGTNTTADNQGEGQVTNGYSSNVAQGNGAIEKINITEAEVLDSIPPGGISVRDFTRIFASRIKDKEAFAAMVKRVATVGADKAIYKKSSPESLTVSGPYNNVTTKDILGAIPDGDITIAELKDRLRRRLIDTESRTFDVILDRVGVRSPSGDVVSRRWPLHPPLSMALAGPSTSEPKPSLAQVRACPPWLIQPGSTVVLRIEKEDVGHIGFSESDSGLDWNLELRDDTVSAFYIREAASRLRTSNVPVAFPTETVYGLGADATRSEAVQGIYRAKQRPSDNPLIVHVCSLSQLRGLLEPTVNDQDPIPQIYSPLIKKFWPGPLTIILPNPRDSKLAPEVTAGLQTFGARMPKNNLALMLIRMAGVPLAAPSANASTKPSPTTAQHVKHDLEGRIDLIVDGGPCDVGVESTVVDGLSNPPAILRPGGVSIEQIRACPGWESVVKGYKDTSEEGSKPKAPGMKYKHYSPRAKVVLYEANTGPPEAPEILPYLKPDGSGLIGIIMTRYWGEVFTWTQFDRHAYKDHVKHCMEIGKEPHHPLPYSERISRSPHSASYTPPDQGFLQPTCFQLHKKGGGVNGWKVDIGHKTEDIARNLFAALRELDVNNVNVIFIEGIDDEGDLAAAVMNRLRKAAEVKVKAPEERTNAS